MRVRRPRRFRKYNFSSVFNSIHSGTLQRYRPILPSIGVALARSGYSERLIASWLGAPLVSDARYVIRQERPPWMRKGSGALIALFVAGEVVERSDLRAFDSAQLDALEGLGLIGLDGGTVIARCSIVPVRGIFIAADRLDESSPSAVPSPDLSAWNMAACLPPRPRRLLDVGCGAGTLTLLAARAGAHAVGTDVDEGALGWARLNALLNGIGDSPLTLDGDGRGSASFVAGDLYSGVADRRSDTLLFNAPLLRAPLAGDAPLYLCAPRGHSLAAEFLDGAAAHLAAAADAEVLCHTQLAPVVEQAATRVPLPLGLTVRFAHALDGTPHALISLRAAADPAVVRSSVRVPLGPALPHLHRELIDRLHATQVLLLDDEALRAAVLRPAPWLALETSALHDGAAFRPRDLRLGDERLEPMDLDLLERCNGGSLGSTTRSDDEWSRARFLVERGLLVG